MTLITTLSAPPEVRSAVFPQVCGIDPCMFPGLPSGGAVEGFAGQFQTTEGIRFTMENKPNTEDDPIGATATVSATDISLSLPGFDWHHSRTYDSRLAELAPAEYEPIVGPGWWADNTALQLRNDGSTAGSLLLTAWMQICFAYTPDGGGNYTVPNFSTFDTMTHDTANYEYELRDVVGEQVFYFHDFDEMEVDEDKRGKLKSYNSTQNDANGLDGATYTHNSDGQVTSVTFGSGSPYAVLYSYFNDTEHGGALEGQIKEVKVLHGVTTIKKAEYTYKASATSPHSDIGTDKDLVQVKTWDSADGGNIERFTQYRYSEEGLLKAVYDSHAIETIVRLGSGISTPEDVLKKADSQTVGSYNLSDLASLEYTYFTGNATTTSITTEFGAGENLNSKYGGESTDTFAETDMVKTVRVGG